MTAARGSPRLGLKRYASLDLSGLRNGYLLVPVTIQGSHAFMILNIANAFSSITENAASRGCNLWRAARLG
jgi:hypothetical protein